MFANRTLASGLVAFGLAFSSLARHEAPPDQFYQTIRNDGIPALRALVAAHGTNVRDAAGLTPIMLAAAFASDDAAKPLVEAGGDVKAAKNDGITALHLAWHSEAVVRLLQQRGADVDAKTEVGSTPLPSRPQPTARPG
jgi:hypothetical protein